MPAPRSEPGPSSHEGRELFANAGPLTPGDQGGDGNDNEPQVAGASFSLSLLRSACDTCWRKKSRCSGEMPCERCERAGVQCTYSTKRKLGRPKRGGAGAAGAQKQAAAAAKKKRKQSACCQPVSCGTPSFSPSPATALAGLAESKFLSCFLEHFCPMFPVANEVSIRDGLMHSFSAVWKGSSSAPLRGSEALRGRALECAFFSSVAIGGLLSGCPPASVATHVDTAQAAVVEFRGLSDRHAVSALILHGMLNILLPLAGSNAEGRRSLDEAQAIFESLPEKPRLFSVVLAFRRQVEGLSLLGGGTLSSASSGNCNAVPGQQVPVAAVYRQTAILSPSAMLPSEGAAYTEEGLAILKGVELGRGGGSEGQTTPIQHAHPAHVVADALLLGIRFVREQGRTGSVRLRHVHDFVASELNRLVRVKAGAMVLISLAGVLLGIKTRLQLTDGMLPAAELTLAMIQECPGWVRSYGRHAAHLSLAVFRLHGRREAYDTLKKIVGESHDEFIPDLDFPQHDGHVCGLEICTTLGGLLLTLKPAGTGAAGVKVVTPGGGGGGAVVIPCAKTKRQRRPSARHAEWVAQQSATSDMEDGVRSGENTAPVEGKVVYQTQMRQVSTPSAVAPATTRASEGELATLSSLSTRLSLQVVPASDEMTIGGDARSTVSMSPVNSVHTESSPTTSNTSSDMSTPAAGRGNSGCASDEGTCVHPPSLPPLPRGGSKISGFTAPRVSVGAADAYLATPAGALFAGGLSSSLPEARAGLEMRMQQQLVQGNGSSSSSSSGSHVNAQRQPVYRTGYEATDKADSTTGGGSSLRPMDWHNGQVTDEGRWSSPQETANSAAAQMMTMVPPLQPREISSAWALDSRVADSRGGGGGDDGGGGSGRNLNVLPLPDIQVRGQGFHQRQYQHHHLQQQLGNGQWSAATSGGMFSGGAAVGGEGKGDEGARHHSRHPSFRAGSDFDFVSELGFLLEEDDLYCPTHPRAEG